MKYFNMEKELSFKQTELKDAFVKHQKELEKIEMEKKDLKEESERQKVAMEEKFNEKKAYLLKQINLIKKKSGDKINLSSGPIVL